ncbi:MAG: SDR family oxidoreductase [bacterium]
MSKTILITGISYGLGKVLFERFSDNPQYFTAGISRSSSNTKSNNTIAMKADITKIDDIDACLLKIKDSWGGLDVLINNAGIVGDFKKIEDYTNEEVNTLVDINIKGTFLMTQRAVRIMRRPGYIINIGSTRSITGAPNKTLYSMTKFALRGLTQSINSEMKKDGIISTIVCPGSFKTVPLESIALMVENLINLPFEAHVPEVIIGGML